MPLTPLSSTPAVSVSANTAVCHSYLPLLPPPHPTALLPQCPAIPIVNKIAACVIEGSVEEQRLVRKLLLKLTTIDAVIASHVIFVLSYLENFKIKIVEKLNLDRSNMELQSNSLIPQAAYYPYQRTLFLLKKFINEKNFLSMLHHEFTHLKWHTMAVYSFSTPTKNPYCFYPYTLTEQTKVRKMIEKGDARLQELRVKLIEQEELSVKEKKTFNHIRAELKQFPDIYNLPTELEIPEHLFLTMEIGQSITLPGEFDKIVAGRGTIVAKKILSSAYVLFIQMDDPLIALLNRQQDYLKEVKTLYQSYAYEYEREAYLYQSMPVSLIKKFYREFFAYTESLTHRHMQQADPFQICSPSDKRFYLESQYHAVLHYVRHVQGGEFSITDRKLMLEKVTILIAQNYDASQLHNLLTALLQRGVATKEVNILLAQLAYRELAMPKVCNYYHRAFKANADFSFEDYHRYIGGLISTAQWGEAKVVCQKVRQLYRQQYQYIPLEIEEYWQRIKNKRAG